MFKGTQEFGTQNYEQEKPMLDQIEQLFEQYRTATDEARRTQLYRQIDSISYEASKLAIPNEYDKLMAAIGADGTNAYTSYDQTVYIEDIPSNQIENWARIQADRFKHNVIRGFHTELETVYEEKNMSLTQDARKVLEQLLAGLFPHHPYGTQTVLGSQEHLKNPSIINIKNYYKNWYVPNNMAICLSGDFDPDYMIRVINTYFGDMPSHPDLPKLSLQPEQPITTPKQIEVIGPDAQSLMIGWRFPGASSPESELLNIMTSVLRNGKAGLIDINLIQKQKVLSAYASMYDFADYTAFFIQARPKQGQSLEELQTIVLAEIEKLKAGDFDESLLASIINNERLSQMYQLEENYYRADLFVTSFVNRTDWAGEVGKLDRMAQITKEQIVAFANQYLGNNYVSVYKREGKDPNEQKIAKPQITPIFMNRDTSSAFLRDIQASAVAPIEPVFLDFTKDMQQFTAKSGIPVLYKQNVLNGTFSMEYIYEFGTNSDKALSTACRYLPYLGTSAMTPEEIKSAFYRLACSFSVSSGAERTTISLSGLSENMKEAMALLEQLLTDAQPDHPVYNNLAADMIKQRNDSKLNQGANFSALLQYAVYGPKSSFTNVLSSRELREQKPEDLLVRIRDIANYEHKILYYGPKTQDELLQDIADMRRVPSALAAVPVADPFKQEVTPGNEVLLAHYDAKQIYMAMISNRGERYDLGIDPLLTLYNEYFGGSMNAIVFQEMREARGLAYSANAGLYAPGRPIDAYVMQSFIATQNDKMIDAAEAFLSIINDLPESEKAFDLAKDAVMARLRTQRITKMSVLYQYLRLERMGLKKEDTRIALYQQIPSLTFADVKAFQEQWVKNRTYRYCILGDEKDLDMKNLATYGPIKRLTKEDIFGY